MENTPFSCVFRISQAVMEQIPPLPFLMEFRASAKTARTFRARRDAMEYEDPDMNEFISECAKQFCPWCGVPVVRNRTGRRKKFCSDKCRWAFWKFETRHKDLKSEMEARLNENR